MTLNVIKWQAAMREYEDAIREYHADLLIWKARRAGIVGEIKKIASGKISNRFGSMPEAKAALLGLQAPEKPKEPTLARM